MLLVKNAEISQNLQFTQLCKNSTIYLLKISMLLGALSNISTNVLAKYTSLLPDDKSKE